MNNAILMQNLSKVLPNNAVYNLDKKLENLSEDKLNTLMIYKFKNPTLCLVLSIFLGNWGVDRFYIGDIKMGLIKLIAPIIITTISILFIFIIGETFGGGLALILFLAYLVFLIVDMFRSFKECKELNYQAFLNIIR